MDGNKHKFERLLKDLQYEKRQKEALNLHDLFTLLRGNPLGIV